MNTANAQRPGVLLVQVRTGSTVDDARAANDLQAMATNLNAGTDYYNYTYTSVARFSDIGSKTEGYTRIYVFSEADYKDGKFTGKLVDVDGFYNASDIVKTWDVFYCGMDGNNEILNVDDFGARIAAKVRDNYKNVTETGPLGSKTPRNGQNGTGGRNAWFDGGSGRFGGSIGEFSVSYTWSEYSYWGDDGTLYIVGGWHAHYTFKPVIEYPTYEFVT